MPVLRWPHAHHRDLQARLDAAIPTTTANRNQNRYVMIAILTSHMQNADRTRWSLIRHGGARSNVRLRPQRGHRSSWLKPNTRSRGQPIMRMDHIEAAGKALNLRLEGDANEHERQWKSDQMLAEARHLLYHARGAFEAQDRDRAAAHVEKAIDEIDRAIGKEPVRQRYSEPYRPDPYRR